jgi:hypothetical protein
MGRAIRDKEFVMEPIAKLNGNENATLKPAVNIYLASGGFQRPVYDQILAFSMTNRLRAEGLYNF